MASGGDDPDFYAVLGLLQNASIADIAVARKQLLIQAQRADDSQLTYAVNGAFEVLGNDGERARYDRYGHADLSLIRPGLFLGGESAARRPAVLRDLGVTHVLTCAHSLHYLQPVLQKAGLNHIEIPVEDSDAQDLTEYFEAADAFISGARSSGAILVHCQYGVSRSASFVVQHLMATEGLTFEQALSSIQNTRPKANPGQGFQNQLSARCAAKSARAAE